LVSLQLTVSLDYRIATRVTVYFLSLCREWDVLSAHNNIFFERAQRARFARAKNDGGALYRRSTSTNRSRTPRTVARKLETVAYVARKLETVAHVARKLETASPRGQHPHPPSFPPFGANYENV
jgi:hypothetical protein